MAFNKLEENGSIRYTNIDELFNPGKTVYILYSLNFFSYSLFSKENSKQINSNFK